MYTPNGHMKYHYGTVESSIMFPAMGRSARPYAKLNEGNPEEANAPPLW